jgi:IS5 family transposase
VFLAAMERVVPWSALCELIEPVYSKPGNDRPPVGVERMPRTYFLHQWFNRSDPAVGEALCDSQAMRRLFLGGFGRSTLVRPPAGHSTRFILPKMLEGAILYNRPPAAECRLIECSAPGEFTLKR